MAESRTATILVTDLVGSTERRVALGEERADEVRRTHDEFLRVAITSEGGTVIKGLGDGVLALFTGASDAVAASVNIQQAAYAYNRDHAEEPLDIRVGISAGDVTLDEGDCFGTPVVEASRLCAAAVGGQILAADLVRLLARGRGGHTFTAGGERELKGLPDPVPVVLIGWEPPEVTAAGIPFPARLTPQAALPFSGRGAELEVLAQAWKEATAGERRVVLISGEPGIGKTRLAAQIARRAHDQGTAVLFGRCDEDMGVAFQPFVDALEQVVQSGPALERMGRYAGELVRLVPALARAIPGLEPPLQSDPETERYRLFDAVASWIAALSEPGGVLLVLDDLHWAEKPTLLLLRHLVRSEDLSRLLIIGTYRDTDLDRTHPLAAVLADFRRETGVSRLPVPGLDIDGISELLANASGNRMDERAAELARVLWAETEGNPFFVQEILRSLVESGRLVQRDTVWTTDLEIEDLAIPEGIREVIGRRLNRLSDAANEVLSVASVLGPVVDTGLLVSIAGLTEDAVLDGLDEATAASLLRETSTGAYEFTHALVRSTLYDELSTARRARRHRQVAEALERRSGDPTALAYHFARAGMTDRRALDHAAAAGEHSLQQLAFDQAVTFFSQALEMADDFEAPEVNRGKLLVQLGRAQRLAGLPEYRETLLEAASLAQADDDSALLIEAALENSRGFWSVAGVLDEDRIRTLEAALAAVGSADSPSRARLLAVLALELTWHDVEGRRFGLADEARSVARRVGDERCVLDVWTASHLSTWNAMTVPALVTEVDDVLALAERVGDQQEIVLASSWAAVHTMELGLFEKADRLIARIAEIAAGVSNPLFGWLEATYRCCRMMPSSSSEEVEAAAVAAFQRGQDAGQPDAFIWFAPQLYVVRATQGRLLEVIDLVRQETINNPGLPIWRIVLASALAQIGERDESVQILDEVLAAGSDPVPNDALWLCGHGYLAELIVSVGTPEQAQHEYPTLAPYADRTPCIGTLLLPSVHVVLGGLAALAGWPEKAEEHFAAAAVVHERLGATAWLPATWLEWGRFLVAEGATDRGAALLRRARDAAVTVGAGAVVSRANALLGEPLA